MRRFVLVVLAGLLAVGLVADQSLRPPTPAEQKALDKCNSVLTRLLDQTQSDDWEESEGERYTLDEAQVSIHSDRPLDINTLLERTYNVRQGSERFNKLIQPLIEKLQREPDMNAKQKIGAQLQGMMHLKLSVHLNRLNAEINPAPSQNQDLKISGTALAYKVQDNSQGHGSAYVLLFGDWQKAKWDSGNGWLHFAFAHANGTPYIENLEVHLYGADDRIQELLHSMDWNQVNGALTR